VFRFSPAHQSIWPFSVGSVWLSTRTVFQSPDSVLGHRFIFVPVAPLPDPKGVHFVLFSTSSSLLRSRGDSRGASTPVPAWIFSESFFRPNSVLRQQISSRKVCRVHPGFTSSAALVARSVLPSCCYSPTHRALCHSLPHAALCICSSVRRSDPVKGRHR
jgi:hypothetical protein